MFRVNRKLGASNRKFAPENRNILRPNRKVFTANRKLNPDLEGFANSQQKIPLQKLEWDSLCVLSNFNPTVFDAGYYGLGTVVYVHFLKYAGYVIFYSFFGDEQCFSDCAVTLAICK